MRWGVQLHFHGNLVVVGLGTREREIETREIRKKDERDLVNVRNM